MSTQCRHFVQNAWKKELCSNCFKSREEHASVQEQIRPIVARTANTVKRVAHKVQGILRLKESHAQVRSKRKNVAFPESLAEIIGYDGGDESAGSDDEQPHDEPDELSASFDVDDLPDSEEERALGNLTRANTNFNTVTANLNAGPVEAKPQAKSFNTLMLGRAQKDSDGKKKTLLVSVTPFGADDTLPTARRPSDKKSPEVSKPKPSLIDNSESAKTNSELSPVVKSVAPKKSSDDKPTETSTATSGQAKTSGAASSLGKIVDMPLITSTNLMSVMRDDLTAVSTVDKSTEQKRTTSIARTPAIKKPENEKPRIYVAQQSASSDQNAARNHKNLEMSNGVELNLSPIRNEVNVESSSFGKEIPKFKADYSRESSKARANLADLTERKVEGEAAVSISSSEKYPFEESRESAGEPDGKADEEVVAEPPALPKSPPPIEAPFSSDKRSLSCSAEPRASFLHGTSEASKTTKPAVPQKPLTLPPAKFVGSSLASLLSENRAYEYRLSQSQRNSAGGLMHSQSESQLCPVDDEPAKRNSAPGVQTKISADSCSQLNQTEHLYKATCVKTVEKDDQTEEEIEAEEDEDSEASSTDQPRSTSKRRMAPQPPSCSDETATSLFARNPASLSSGLAAKSADCPVVREKEKRERASSCSPKFRKTVSDAPDPCAVRPPEPAPRRNISLSQDSLAPAACSERVVEEKKKARSKFSLKKFLRMGTRKDVDMTGASGTRNDEIPSTPQPKPRLEIIHPLELDGAAVQVLRNDKSTGEDTTDSKSENQSNSNQSVPAAQHITTRPSKPPPPPRAQSLEESSKSRISAPKLQQTSSSNGNSGSGKPLVGKSWQPSGGSSASDSIYANLGPAAAEDVAGAIRSALAPAKPRRTSSMRDQQQQQQQPAASAQPASPSRQVPAGSVGVVVGQQRHCVLMLERQRTHTPLESPVSSDSQGYECLSSSLDNSSSSELELRGHQGSVNHPITKRQSDSSALESSSSELKFQQSLFTRSSSLPYCASESESELYSPFSYYHGDEISEEGQDRKDEESRIGRLRQRRGRSIVHRSLEDNYGAVIVANHEALAQFLEQMNQAPSIAAGLRGLKSATNLQFRDFSVERSTALVWGRRIFFSASWNEQSVTLCVAFDRPSMHVSRREFYLAPILEFIDTVPKDVAEMLARKNYDATISVLPRLQVNTIKSFAESISKPASGMKEEHAIRESSFVLLQLVSALKSLQARAIEEAPADLTNVVLCREDKDAYHRLYLFQGLNIDSENNEEECGSLCQCALNALEELNLAKKLPLIRELLMREKAVTLSQVKSVLEFSLWGPADATLGGPRERELALQRWLDLERATVLQALVRARAQLTVTDEYQLLFLVRTSAKIMCEASLLLDRQRSGLLLPRATLDR